MIKGVAIGLGIFLGLIVIGSLLLISVLVVFGCLAVLLGRRLLPRIFHTNARRLGIVEAQYKVVVDVPPQAVPSLPVRIRVRREITGPASLSAVWNST